MFTIDWVQILMGYWWFIPVFLALGFIAKLKFALGVSAAGMLFLLVGSAVFYIHQSALERVGSTLAFIFTVSLPYWVIIWVSSWGGFTLRMYTMREKRVIEL